MTWMLFNLSCYVLCISPPSLALFRSALAISLLTLFALLAAIIANCCAASRSICCSGDSFPRQISYRPFRPSRCLSTAYSLCVQYCTSQVIVTFYLFAIIMKRKKMAWLFLAINDYHLNLFHINSCIETTLRIQKCNTASHTGCQKKGGEWQKDILIDFSFSLSFFF